MTVIVVDFFEIVKVGENENSVFPFIFRSFENTVGELIEAPSVPKQRQCVFCRAPL